VRRWTCEPRPDWRARVEAQGLVFHSARETGVYWGEGAYYEFSANEIRTIEAATAELHAMCIATVRHVIERRRYAELGLEPIAVGMIERSWADQPPSLYGRMDLAFGPDGVPKLLEYNADTPTSLLEAAVIQWTWLADTFPHLDQATAMHDKLIATWRAHASRLGPIVHFACVADLEDQMTIGYLRDTCEQAGLKTVGLVMEDVGWDATRGQLVDLDDRPITALFKLYPWEGLVLDDLATLLPEIPIVWIEPAWKMILSNKAILPILWELFPGHPNLLPASREPGCVGDAFVKKPVLGREGSNVTVVAPGVEQTTAGPYDDRGYVYQAYAELGEHDGMRPVIGAWLIAGAPAGIGIRETAGYVTSNTARFVPHVVR
jgi:glutathionylspermidine synthase